MAGGGGFQSRVDLQWGWWWVCYGFFWIWVLLDDLGFVAVGLVGFCGRLWFLVVVVVGSDMGWICNGVGGGFVMGFLDLGFCLRI